MGIPESPEDASMTARMVTMERTDSRRRPVIFTAHGAPVLLDDAVWMSELSGWGRAMPRPRSILMEGAFTKLSVQFD